MIMLQLIPGILDRYVASLQIVDVYPEHRRGRALGVLNLTGQTGSLVGGFIATSISATTYQLSDR